MDENPRGRRDRRWPVQQSLDRDVIVPRRRKRRALPIEIAIWIICVGLMAVIGLSVRDAMVNPSERIIPPAMKRIGELASLKDPFNGKRQLVVLLVGTDKAADLTDTIMLAFVDLKQKRVGLLSFPRDTLIAMPTGDRVKINSIVPMKMNSGKNIRTGIAALEQALTNNYGIRIDRYACIDIDAFCKVVDALGGVDLEVPKGPHGDGLHYEDPSQNLRIHLSPGPQHMDGYNAMGFVRWRQDQRGRGDGDEGRVARQQQFMQAVASKVGAKLKQRNAESLTVAGELGAIACNHLTTDLKALQLATLAGIAREVDMSGIDAHRAPDKGQGMTAGQGFVFYPDVPGTRAVIKDMLADMARPKPLAAVARIEILNACGVYGTASRCKKTLIDKEFRVVRVGNATNDSGAYMSDVANTVIRTVPGFEKAAQAVASNLKVTGATVVSDLPRSSDVDIQVILGRDYAASD